MLVTGDAGIGKTRLLAELQRAVGEGATWHEGRCQSFGGLRSWPFVEILRDWLGVENDDPEIVVRTKARARLGVVLGTQLPDVLPPLGRLLRIELEPTMEERVQVQPGELAREVRRAYVAWLQALAERGPVVVALDDMQWADQSTRELADDVLQLTDRAPVLFAATMRLDAPSEGARLRLHVLADWSHRAVELSLRPLPDAAARRLLSTLLPGALDGAAQTAIIERAEGNPLYLEELLRALVESGDVVERRRTWTFATGAAVRVPPALENVLVTRIDRLPSSARRAARTAAVIGRNFQIRILEHIADGDVRSDLLTLLQAGIVKEVRRYPEFECTFKHGLLQEAALSTLLPVRRRALYARAAAAFEELYAPSLDDHLERVAYYQALARNLPSALDYLERAARRASSLDARERAERLADRSRAIAASLGDA